jgi:hypothetical protein
LNIFLFVRADLDKVYVELETRPGDVIVIPSLCVIRRPHPPALVELLEEERVRPVTAGCGSFPEYRFTDFSGPPFTEK